MCIGIPMQVEQVEPRHATVAGRGERRRVGTSLVGTVAAGDWLLVFLDDARERIDAQRAAEVNAVLDIVAAAMNGQAAAAQPDVELPSRMSAEQLRALTGAAKP